MAAQMTVETVAGSETGEVQPSLPELFLILISIGQELRIRIEDFDDHDKVLDERAARFPKRQRALEEHRDRSLDNVTEESNRGVEISGETIRKCPRCGGPVIYHGRGRRPVWCSTRCRNEAAVARRGARETAVEIRMIDVPKQPRRGRGGTGSNSTVDGDVEAVAPTSEANERAAPAGRISLATERALLNDER